MAEHRFDPSTERCLGCDIARSDVADPPRAKGERHATAAGRTRDCPAVYARIENGGQIFTAIITPAEEFRLIRNGASILELDQKAAFDLRDAIEDGIRELRDSGRSKAAPR